MSCFNPWWIRASATFGVVFRVRVRQYKTTLLRVRLTLL